MARLVLALVLLAGVCAIAQAQGTIYVTLQVDNTAKEVNAQMNDIMKEVADKTCDVSTANVKQASQVLDQSTTLDSKSTVVFTCTGDQDKMYKKCSGSQSSLKDEVKDNTSAAGGGEIEVEKLTCTTAFPTSPPLVPIATTPAPAKSSAAALATGALAAVAGAAALLAI